MRRFAWQDERTDSEYIQRFLHVSIGVISIPLALYLVLVLLGMTVMAPNGFTVNKWEVGIIALLLASTAFFGLVGFRLISGRGAKAGGGLLSPIGYLLLGSVLVVPATLVFVTLVIGIATKGIHLKVVVAVIPLLLFGIPSVLCFVAAHRRAKVVSQG